MFGKLLNKIIEAEPATSCFEVKTATGLTITAIGKYGLETAVQTLTRLGLYTPSSTTEAVQEEAAPTAITQPPRHASFVEGYDLPASITAACRDAMGINLEQIDVKISELMAAVEGEGTLLMSEAKRQFLNGFDHKRTHHSSLASYQFFFETFIDLVGDKKLNTIKSSDVTLYLNALAHYPTNASKKIEYQGKTFSDIVHLAKEVKAKSIRVSTQKKHVNYMRAFFNWCYEKLDLRRNPTLFIRMKRYKRSDEQARTPFEADDLQRIFDRLRTQSYKKPHKFWVPLIALYSGMRVNEIAQMAVADIVYVETGLDEEGRPIKEPCFQVLSDPGSDPDGVKHTKTENSERVVPIHSKLLELGFLDYLEDVRRRGFKYLFPGVTRGINGPGATISSWFNNSLLRTKCEIFDKAKTFHAFRNTFWTLGDRSKILVTAMRKLVGYNPGDSVERIHYIKRADVRECKEALESIQYPTLDLATYDSKQFESYLDSTKAKAKPDDFVTVVLKKKPGRPAGSKNRPKATMVA